MSIPDGSTFRYMYDMWRLQWYFCEADNVDIVWMLEVTWNHWNGPACVEAAQLSYLDARPIDCHMLIGWRVFSGSCFLHR